jgi:sugar/nucleoside kinase (ribokinase family)
MWLIDNKTFLNSEETEGAIESLCDYAAADALTFVVGNGPSMSSTLLHSLTNNVNHDHPASWSGAVKKAAELAGIDQSWIGMPDVNLLALAESILVAEDEVGRSHLLNCFQQAFSQDLPISIIHQILCDIHTNSIVTTNYDFLLERAFNHKGLEWQAIVRNAKKSDLSGVKIIKMHGTLRPAKSVSDRYVYPEQSDWRNNPEKSVVISERDYDDCTKELKNDDENILLKSLQNPCVFIGKTFGWQDLSFLYALRKTKKDRKKSYAIVTSLNNEEKLNLHNLGITPLIINMPNTPEPGHYYVALVKALIKCFSPYNSNILEYEDKINQFSDIHRLRKRPAFVAIGLASHNTIGRVEYKGANDDNLQKRVSKGEVLYHVPPAGRRNLAYDAEEYVGGAALIPTGAFASLDHQHEYTRSIISVIGKEDIFTRKILQFCQKYKINTDGVSQTADQTWRSTVLVHDSEAYGGLPYPGQRIFLDRGFRNKIEFEKSTIEQLQAQIDVNQEFLRLVYFDKFLALPYPSNHGDADRKGLLEKYKKLFDNLAENRENVDIVYETGAGGSFDQRIELLFSKNINILTAGFPFFASKILDDGFWSYSRNEIEFRDKWFEKDFTMETKVAENVLRYFKLNSENGGIQQFVVSGDLLENAKKYLRREHRRKWLIGTMHHYGAIAIDLNTKKAFYFPVQSDDRVIQNTTGAGDTFRGAFCYALLKYSEIDDSGLLKKCVAYSVDVASEKCRYFKMKDAFENIKNVPIAGG